MKDYPLRWSLQPERRRYLSYLNFQDQSGRSIHFLGDVVNSTPVFSSLERVEGWLLLSSSGTARYCRGTLGEKNSLHLR